MICSFLVVAIRVQDVLLDTQVVVKVVKDLINLEVNGHFVTLID